MPADNFCPTVPLLGSILPASLNALCSGVDKAIAAAAAEYGSSLPAFIFIDPS